ncbi:MAG TPA: hypothetical protein VIL00_09930 [Pseudonocardiaceae bacterium]
MGEQGFRVDEEALASYAHQAPGLAQELSQVGGDALSSAVSVPADCFGRLGQEIGLHAAFHQAAQATVDAVTAAADGLGGLGRAVADSLAGYQRQDADTAADLRQASQI